MSDIYYFSLLVGVDFSFAFTHMCDDQMKIEKIKNKNEWVMMSCELEYAWRFLLTVDCGRK